MAEEQKARRARGAGGDSAEEARGAEPTTVEQRVLFDSVAWLEPNPQGGDPMHRRARRGDTVTLPVGEAERLRGLGAVTSVEDYPEDAAAFRAATVGPEERDDQLLAMTGAELVAYVTQHPTEARRVFMLERANQARPLVLNATGVDDLDEDPGLVGDPVGSLVNPTGTAPSRLDGA